MSNVTRNVRDSIFTNMFRQKKYTLKLYQGLHPEEKGLCEDDINIITIQNAISDGIYNDLGFSVKNRVVVLMEAQSTWSVNILVREFIYLGRTLYDYISANAENTYALYSRKKVELPNIELYVVYNGERKDHPSVLSLNDEFFHMEVPVVDLKVNVIYGDDDRTDYIGEYLQFCNIYQREYKQNKESGLDAAISRQNAIEETFRICIDKQIMLDYLKDHKKEVTDIMIELMSQEEVTRTYGRSMYQEGKAEGIVEGKAEGKAEGRNEVYAELIRVQRQKNASPEDVQEIFKNVLGQDLSLEKITELMASVEDADMA